jgi:hypothetical protein
MSFGGEATMLSELTVVCSSHSPVLSAHTPISHQLRPPTDLHDVYVLSRSRRHQSFVHLPPERGDRSCKLAHLRHVADIGLTRTTALFQSQSPHSTPALPLPTSPRQHTQHQRQRPSARVITSITPTVSHLFPPHALPQTACCVLPAAWVCCARNCAAYCAGGSGESEDLPACRQYGRGC